MHKSVPFFSGSRSVGRSLNKLLNYIIMYIPLPYIHLRRDPFNEIYIIFHNVEVPPSATGPTTYTVFFLWLLGRRRRRMYIIRTHLFTIRFRAISGVPFESAKLQSGFFFVGSQALYRLWPAPNELILYRAGERTTRTNELVVEGQTDVDSQNSGPEKVVAHTRKQNSPEFHADTRNWPGHCLIPPPPPPNDLIQTRKFTSSPFEKIYKYLPTYYGSRDWAMSDPLPRL